MCEWIPGSGKSPDRVDALTWSLSMLDLNNDNYNYCVYDNEEIGYGSKSSEGLGGSVGYGSKSSRGFWDGF